MLRIKGSGGFIQYHDFRMHDENVRDRHKLLLPAAQCMGRSVLKRRDAQLLDDPLHFPFCFRLIYSQVHEPERNLLIHARGEELIIRLLEYDTDLPPQIEKPFSRVFHRCPVDQDPPVIRSPDPVQAEEKG